MTIEQTTAVDATAVDHDPVPLPSEATPGSAWMMLVILSVTVIVAFTDRQILSLLVEPVKSDLGLTETRFSLVQGLAFAASYSTGALLMGRLADVFNRRNLLMAGIALWTIATVGCGYSHSFQTLFVNRVLVGIGEAVLAPVAISMISDSFPRTRRGLAVGVFFMSITVGIASAITFGGALIHAVEAGVLRRLPVIGGLSSWRASLVILIVPGVLLLALLAAMREPTRHGGADARQSLFPRLSPGEARSLQRVVLPLCIGMSVVAVGEYTSLSWAPALLMRVYGWTTGDVASGFGVSVAVAGAGGALLGGFLGDRYSRSYGPRSRVLLALVAAVGALIGAFVGFARSASTVVMMVCLLEFCSSMVVASCTTAVQEIVPVKIRALAVALVSFGSAILGMGFGVVGAAVLTEHVYRDPAAVGLSISTIVIPSALVALACLLFGQRKAPTHAAW
jgi:MFS family permease